MKTFSSTYHLTAFILLAATASWMPAAEPHIEIISVLPNKIVYDDGETGTVRVRVTNPLDAPREVTLQSTLKWDLEDSQPLESVKVTVPAKGEGAATITLPKLANKWGHEVEVRALVGDQAVDTGRQFFEVNRDWMDVVIVANMWEWFHIDEYPFMTYTTLSHYFAWASGDYVGNAPSYDEWWSGQTGYHMFKKPIQEAIKQAHEVGVHCTFYDNSFSNGAAGVEWARQHPEWVCRERNGLPKLGGSALALAKPFSAKETGANGYVQIDFYDPKCIEWGARNVVESVKMFGWDGLFWDCGGCCLFPAYSYDGQPAPHGQDPDRISERNFRMFREIVRKEYPHFAFWYNGGIEYYKLPFWTAFGNGGGLPSYETMMSGSNSSMLAEFRGHESPGTEFNNWRRCYDSYARERDGITQAFGTPVTAGYTWGMDTAGELGAKVKASRQYWVAGNHLNALYLATQMHTTANPNPPLYAGTQFMTRYSGLLWRRDVKIIAEPEKLLAVNLSRPVWWEKSVYRRPAPKGEDLLVHLVNAPETENVDIFRVPDPPAASGKVTLALPAGKKLRSAWALQMRGYLDEQNRGGAPLKIETRDNQWIHTAGSTCRQGPSQVELKASVEGGRVTVEVPPFLFHTLLVFRLEGSAKTDVTSGRVDFMSGRGDFASARVAGVKPALPGSK